MHIELGFCRSWSLMMVLFTGKVLVSNASAFGQLLDE